MDGSYQEKSGRAGAGIFFADGDAHNEHVPVPLPLMPDVKMCSVRAELYAAVCALYVLQVKKHTDFRFTSVVIKQDCVKAIALLKFVQTLPKAPSRWLHDENTKPAAERWMLKLPWNEILNYTTLVTFQDVLDVWWGYALHTHIRFIWLPAHLDNKGNRLKSRSCSSSSSSVSPACSSVASSAHLSGYKITEHDRVGNSWADIYARSAANLDLSIHAEQYLDYPLFPKTSKDATADYLPLT